MNMLISNEFGQYFARLPLKKAAKIVHADALETDWENVVSKNELSFIIGNPPFIGSKIMKQSQRDQIVKEFDNADGSGVLDYVTGWYIKAAKYILTTKIKVAFVSTNSIVQGEQTSILWGQMLNKYKIKIHFAHRTFKWSNEAKGNAAVYCVIIGFANFDTPNKSIFEYEDIKGEAHEQKVKNINPYLVDAKDLLIKSRSKSLCNVPEIGIGNKPIDGGNYLFTEIEKIEFIKNEPLSEKYFYKWIGGDEFLNGFSRWCLFLGYADPADLKLMPNVLKRIKLVKEFRLNSISKPTQKLAETPTKFHVVNIPLKEYLIMPEIALNKRKYFTVGYVNKDILSSNLVKIMPDGTLYHFGVLSSFMFITWFKSVGGQLGNQYRFSKDIVYNNYPWPENPSDKQTKAIETAAQKVLDARLQFPNSSLADLYDPLTMPPVLVKAHNELDKAVDLAYRPQAFTSEANRMVFLFELYEKYTKDLFTKEKVKKKK
jgi:hypothetical protein